MDGAKTVPLSRGLVAVVDAADYPALAQHEWHATLLGRSATWYAARTVRRSGTRQTVLMHREIVGAPAGLEVDHRNRDGLDNRRSNLRVCTHAENLRNARRRSDNTSGLKGVGWHRQMRKWRARIRIDGRSVHLGLFATPEEAHAAYVAASQKLHGSFGRT